MPRTLLVPSLFGGVLALAISGPAPGAMLAAEPIAPEDLIFVSDDTANGGGFFPGCDRIKVVDSRTGRYIGGSHYQMSPGRLTATSDGSLVLSVLNNSNPRGYWVRVMMRQPGEPARWVSKDVGVAVPWGGPVTISPDDETMLLALRTNAVAKYGVAGISRTSLGQSTGSFEGILAAEIVFAHDSRTAYLIDTFGEVQIVDVETMTPAEDPIPYSPVEVAGKRRLRNIFAALSPDGRYLVINTGGPRVNVLDLVGRRSILLDTPELSKTRGLGFNYAVPAQNLLAIHGHRAVAVYRFHGTDPLQLLARTPVSGQDPMDTDFWAGLERLDSLAWTGRGDGVIVAISGWQEFRILDLESSPTWSLRRRRDFDACEQDVLESQTGMQLDVITLNRLPASPTPSPSPVPSATATPPDATFTPSPTVTPSSTPTLADTAMPTPTPTRVPQPIYLPLLLKEDCDPTQLHADVALVIDASTSMLEETRDKRTKLAAAIEAVELFLGELNLPLDQAAVVQFNGGVELLQELTGDRSALVDSLDRIQVKRQTRIDLGIAVARAELKSSRRRPGNQSAMIVLTDGRANPVGPDAAVREAEAAKADKITIFTIGLGADLNLEALEAIASKSSYFYRAPDAEDLADIYSKIAVEIPCPAEDFWGQR